METRTRFQISGVGALLAYSGLEGAVLNIRINIPGISEKAVIHEAVEKYKGYLAKGERAKAEIMAIVDQRITGGVHCPAIVGA